MKTLSMLMMVAALSAPPQASAQVMSEEMQEQIEKLQSMSPEERQQLLTDMQVNAEEMQQCVDSAGGQAALDELQNLTNAHREQVSSLCKAGKRDQAQAYAEQAANELQKDARVQKLKNCSRIALQNLPQLSAVAENGGVDPNKHVCD